VQLTVNDGVRESMPSVATLTVSDCVSPGEIPPTLMLTRNAAGGVLLEWESSCLAAADYGIYEGRLGDWYSHVQIDCNDTDGVLLSEEVFLQTGDRYLLVAPYGDAEGGMGHDPAGAPRPQPATAADRCVIPGAAPPVCP
jgi:hypothetical protein